MQILYSIVTALCLCIGFYFGFKLGRTNELPRFKTKTKRKQVQEEKQEAEAYAAQLKAEKAAKKAAKKNK